MFCTECGTKILLQEKFCSKCGTAVHAQEVPAPVDLHQIDLNESIKDNVSTIPERIRQNLAKSSKHENLTCLECGYVGLMGIVRIMKKFRYPMIAFGIMIPFILLSQYWWFMMYTDAGQVMMMEHLSDTNPSIFWISLDIFSSGIFGNTSPWVWAILGGLWWIVFRKETIFLQCPNCEKELTKK